MASSRKTKSGSTPRALEHDDTPAVKAWLAALDDPRRPLVEAVRNAILGSSPAITEGVKWSSPSFHHHGWFAAVHVRSKTGVQVVLHHGAKVRGDAKLSETIEDPARLLTWKSPDRAVVSFNGADDFVAKRAAFMGLIRRWAAYQGELAGSP